MCDLNSATPQQILTLRGVTPTDAYELLLWRPYRTWDQVMMVPGYDFERVAALRNAGATLELAAVSWT
jgi:DNA uptake protein ComE-like DNA-binding protein